MKIYFFFGQSNSKKKIQKNLCHLEKLKGKVSSQKGLSTPETPNRQEARFHNLDKFFPKN